MGRRLPFRDPRTVARDIPGILDILFPRLTGALVASLNRNLFSFEDIIPLDDEDVAESDLRRAMLFEVSFARAEFMLSGDDEPSWDACLHTAAKRQSRHYDAKIPFDLKDLDKKLATHAADNLVSMLDSIVDQHNGDALLSNPRIPGLGWIASGVGDFEIGTTLIEVKHTDRNFISADFRQVLMYWLLRYGASVEQDLQIWTDCILLNPRRNSALLFQFDELLQSASANSNRVELLELLRSVVGDDASRL